MSIALRAAALGAALCLSQVSHAAVVEEFKAVDWDGLAFTSDATGNFTHCSVYASYKNGSTLYISSESTGSWYLSVSNDKWMLKEGENYPVKFKVDRRGEISGTSGALGEHQIGLPIEPDHAFVGQLRRGNLLTITFEGADYAFELSNSNRAMNAAQDCVRRHVAAGTRTPLKEEAPAAEVQPEEAPAAHQADSDPNSDNPAKPVGEAQAFGSWSVQETQDADGKFVNCTAYGVHGDDQLILSYFSDGVWTFGLYRAAWKLDANQTYYIWYNIDAPANAADVVKRPVQVAEVTRIFFEISDVEDIVERMEGGSVLNVRLKGITGPEENFSYPLDRTKEAFDAARACTAEHAPPAASKDAAPATALPELGSKVLEEMQVPGWKAAAFGDDDGSFTHCAIKAEYQNGATLGFARAVDGDLVLAIQHGDWKLSVGQSATVDYDLSGSSPRQASAVGEAATGSLVAANIGSEAGLTDALKGASQIAVTTEGKTFSFDISDVGPGIEAIDACVAKHAGGESGGTPPVPAAKKASLEPAGKTTASPEPASAESGEIHTEAAGFTTAMLLRSGYPNHIILAANSEAPEGVPPGDALWKLGEVVGATEVFRSGTPEEIRAKVGSRELVRCGGIMTAQTVASDASRLHFTVGCGSASPTVTHYLVLRRAAGGAYLLSLPGGRDEGAAGMVAKAVYDLAVSG